MRPPSAETRISGHASQMHKNDKGVIRRLQEVPVVGRPAEAFHATGVRATYHLHDRFLSNARSRRQLASQRPGLGPLQQTLVDSLVEDGIAVTSFDELLGDQRLWSEMSTEVDRFVEETERSLARQHAASFAGKRDYTVSRYGKKPVLSSDGPWLRFGLSAQVLDVINSYLGLWTKLTYVGQTYTIPSKDQPRTSSQNWHRDVDDRYLIKLFMYFSDVDETAGPFEFVPGTALNGRHADLWPWRPMVTLGERRSLYPPLEEFEQRIPPSEWKSIRGGTGTVIFCNSSGFHRGGFAAEKPRILANWAYVSPASLTSMIRRVFSVDRGAGYESLPEPARFALT
jgi:hypothetical protein